MQTKQGMTISILLATFLAALDSTLMATIGPTVANNLHGMGLYTWLLSAFMMATTIATPIYGKLVDAYPPNRLYVMAIGTFAVGSLGCSLTPNMDLLVVFRFVQGIGAGGMLTLGLVMIGKMYEGADRATMQGRQSAMWGLAGLLGPSLGGVIAQFLSWRLLFLVNVPLSVFVMWRMRNQIIPQSASHIHSPFDYKGASLLTIALLCILAFPTFMQNGVTPWVAFAVLVFGLTSLWLVYFVEKQIDNPLIPVNLLRHSMSIVSLWTGFIASGIMFACALLIPLLVQNGLGASQWQSGLVLLSLPLGWAVGSMLAGKLLPRHGTKFISSAGIVLLTGSILSYQLPFDHSLAIQLFLIGMSTLFAGVGVGFLIMSALLRIQSQTDTNIGANTGLFNLIRNMGNALGAGLLGGINFILFTREHPAGSIAQVHGGTLNAMKLAISIHWTLWITFAIALLLVPTVLGTRHSSDRKTTAPSS